MESCLLLELRVQLELLQGTRKQAHSEDLALIGLFSTYTLVNRLSHYLEWPLSTSGPEWR